MPGGRAPSQGKSTSACGTPLPAGTWPGWRRRIAVMRRCRHLSRACTQLVSRTCAALALAGFEPDDQPTDRPERVSRSPCPSARPVVFAREGPPLNSRTTTLNRDPGRARWPGKLLAGRERGSGRRKSLVTCSSEGESLDGQGWGPGREKRVTGFGPSRNSQWCHHVWLPVRHH